MSKNTLNLPTSSLKKDNSKLTLPTSSNVAVKSNIRSKSRLTDGSRLRAGSRFNLSNDTPDDEWAEAKEPVKPHDQVDLTPEELKKEFTRILSADNPYAPSNIVRFSYVDGEYKSGATVEQLAMHFSMDGAFIHIESDDARRQIARDEMAIINGTKKEAPAAKSVTVSTSTMTEKPVEKVPAKKAAPRGSKSDVTEEEETKTIGGGVLRNQFNFCDRESQSTNSTTRERGMATDPAVRVAFEANALQFDIYDLYAANEERKAALKEKPKHIATKHAANHAKKHNTANAEHSGIDESNSYWFAMAKLFDTPIVSKLERMVNQNTYDDIGQDFKFWEDPSDEFKAGSGSLLPLYKFSSDAVHKRHVTAVVWSPCYNDMFAVSYGSYDYANQLGGHLCIFTLKNPSWPIIQFSTESGIMCMDFHSKVSSLIVVGFYDGSVAVYNVASNEPSKPLYLSTAKTGKHSDSVWKVSWRDKQENNHIRSFVSVSSDGRVSEWTLTVSELKVSDVITMVVPTEAGISQAEGLPIQNLLSGTCVAFNAFDENILLIGTEEGQLLKCSYNYSQRLESKSIQPAHDMVIYNVVWNPYHKDVYATCSADWTVKIWDQTHKDPAFIFDLGNSVEDVAWAPYSATVFAAITSEGKVFVFDLSINKVKAICSQLIIRKAKLTQLAFNPIYPMILVGDERGHVNSYKLSPNLRKAMKGKVPPPAAQIEAMTKVLDSIYETAPSTQ